MSIIGGRKRRDEDDGVKRTLVDGDLPATCKAVGGKLDKKTGRCKVEVETHPDHPKERKTREFDEYITPDDEGGVEVNE